MRVFENFDATSPDKAPLWGFAMAFLRAWYRGKRWKSRMLEASMLAIALLGVDPALQWLGLPQNLAIAVAGWVGYVGVDTLSEWLKKWVGKKLSGGS